MSFSAVLRRLSISARSPLKEARRYGSVDVRGVFAPIVTPFDADESVAYDQLESNMRCWNATDLAGYLVHGSNGENALLTSEERVEMVARVKRLVPEGRVLMAGAGAESTRHTRELCRRMASQGADCVMVVTPSYYKAALDDRALIAHYTAVADDSPVPVLLYSVPANTGIDLSLAAITTLAKHPNIAGVKDSGGDITKLASIVTATKDQDFQVLAGSAGYMLAGLTVGCVGAVCALANAAPELTGRLYRLYQEGRVEEALALQQRLLAANTAVTKTFGVAGLKRAMDLRGLAGGPTRGPLLALTKEQNSRLEAILKEADLF